MTRRIVLLAFMLVVTLSVLLGSEYPWPTNERLMAQSSSLWSADTAAVVVSTDGNVNSNGAPGLVSWRAAEVLEIAGLGLDLAPGTTAGSFRSVFNIENFVNGQADLDALHYVTAPLTLGTTQTLSLQRGDLLFSTAAPETLTSTNTLAVDDHDIVLFRPDTPDDYAQGTFLLVLEDLHLTKNVVSLTLVERAVALPDTTLPAGSFLFTIQVAADDEQIMLFTPTSVGAGMTSGTITTLINGHDLGINKRIHGLHVVDRHITMGGITVQPGHLLFSLNQADTSVGSNNLSVLPQDIIKLTIHSTTLGSGVTSGTLQHIFTGAEVGLTSNAEDLDALMVLPSRTPVAKAGSDRTAVLHAPAELNGSTSYDTEGQPLTWAWTLLEQPAGSLATLSDPSAVLPILTPDQPGDYVVQLVVSTAAGSSLADTVVLSTINSAPTADAGPDRTTSPFQSAFLDGRGSFDPDGDPLTYAWSFVSRPDSSGLIDPTAPAFGFTPISEGRYIIQLVVNDGLQSSEPDQMIVDTFNSAPVADPGPEVIIRDNILVILDGSGSSDADGQGLTYLWAITNAPVSSIASLSSTTSASTTITPDVDGIYVIQLIVNDGLVDSEPATVLLRVGNTAPIADAGVDQAVPKGMSATLDGSGSTDLQGDPLTYQWTLIGQPAGSAPIFTGTDTVAPTLTPDLAGDYTVQLIVNDGDLDSAPDVVTVTATNTPPIANAGIDQRSLMGTTIFLDGTGSSDANGDSLTYQWTLTQRPIDSTAVLSDPTALGPFFTADVDGQYVVELVVNDGFISSALDAVLIIVGNTAPILDPIGNQSIPLGHTLSFPLSGSDPDGDPTTFSVQPVILPTHMIFDQVSGLVTFQPEASQVGDHILTFGVSDAFATTTETVTITVQAPAPGSVTGLSGRILDTNDFVAGGIETPVVGATVSFLGTATTAVSDTNGAFTLSNVPEGTQILDIDASTANAGPGGATYASFRERIDLIANVTKVIDRPFFLPRNDPNSVMMVNGQPAIGVDPTQTTVVTNPTISATLTVPPHTAMMDGIEYTGPLSISEVPEGVAPAALPVTLQPELLVTIQPPGVTFTQALKLTLANREGLPAGNDMNLWSLDPLAGAFEIVGVGRMSSSVINTISGGVRAADWHGFFPPGIGGGGTGGGDQRKNKKKKKETKQCGNSAIALCTGVLSEVHTLASYRSMNTDRSVQLVYTSDTADPYVVIEEDAQVLPQSAVPNQVSMSLRVGVPRLPIHRGLLLPTAPESQPAGLEVGREVFTNTTGLGELDPNFFQPKFGWPLRTLSTGSYPVRVTLTSHFPTSAVGVDIYETVTIHNQQVSPFGAGWGVASVDRLHVQDNGDLLLAQGEGGTQLFEQLRPGLFLPDHISLLDSSDSNPQKVTVADFTNDGIPDLGIPTTFAVPGRFEVHEGLGNGQFQFKVQSTINNQLRAAYAADFDEDGTLDIMSTSGYLSGFVTVAYGDGTGAMVNTFTLATGGGSRLVSTAAVGDVNGDGHIDVLIGYSLSDEVDVHLGTGIRGAAGFLPPTTTTLNGRPIDMQVADLNQDGHLDVVTANNPSMSVLYGDGTGAFPTLLPLGGVSFALTLAVADVSGDGYPDLVTTGNATSQNDRVYLFENNGAGGFWERRIIAFPTGVRPSNIAVGDVTGDGAVDLVVETQGNGFGLAYVPGDGFGAFGPPLVTFVGKKPLDLALAEVDGNGTLDAVLSIQGVGIGNDHVQIFRNPVPGDGFLSPPGEYSTLTQNPDDTFTQRTKTDTVIQYDSEGKQTSVTDRNNNMTTYAYDPQGRLETITDPVGLATTFAYPGGLVTITDPAGRVTQLVHDGQGNVTKIIDPDLSERTFTYNAHHLMTSQINKRGDRTQYVFNDFNQVAAVIRADGSTQGLTPARSLGLIDSGSADGTESNPLPIVMKADAISTFLDGKGQMTTMGFDSFGADTTVTDALGRTTTTIRNDASLPTRITTPNGAVEERTYDAQGNLLTRREAKGLVGLDRTTKFEYHPVFNLVTKITDPANKVTTIVRDPANGNPLQVINPLLDERVRTFTSEGLVETDTDENQQTMQFFYDPVTKNLDRIVDAETHTTRFVRDPAGNVLTLIEGEGTPEQRTRIFTYDTMNRLTSATDGTPNPPTQFRYDAQGNLEETELPTGEIEVRTYDPLNRVASIDDPLRGLTTFLYDPNGNLEQTQNAAQDLTIFDYDAADQLTTITDALNGVQVFDYDVEGNVEFFTDARQKVTTFKYDKLNRQEERISHGGTFTTTFTYDTRDNLEDTTDPKGQLIHRVYDDLSRLTDITTPDNAISIAYDKVGNPTDVTDTDSQVTFTYDGLNRVETALTSQTSGLQPQVLLRSVYDAVGNRSDLQEDGGTSTTSYLYDLAGRLQTLTPPAGAAMNVTLGYDPAGRLTSIVYPNGVNTVYGYDTKGRLDSLSHTLGANPSFASFGYTYNPVGNILDILDQVNPSQNRSHTYDALQRLKTGGTASAGETYDYDLVGNRTTSFLSTSHNHDDLNRLTEDEQFTYTYDNNGNLETKTDKTTSAVTTYHWDAQDQLIQIDRPDSTTVSYKYDGLGRRIEKNVDSSITRYVYDGEDILLEYDGTNAFVARYSHGNQVDQPLVLQKAGVGFFYYHSNHQGSITHLTDSSGTVANSYVYDSYGRRLSVAESVIQPYSYTGREFDVESDLYFYRARYYDPDLGRFLSEDPIRFRGGDQNLYNYVFNSPLNLRDPYGRFPLKPLNPVAQKFAEAIGEAARATKHFLDAFDAMRQRYRAKDQDKFFHCLANCQATKEGPGGEAAAEIISEVRELTDEFGPKGDTRAQCDADRAANEKGREIAKKGGDCNKECSTLSPGIVFPP